MATIHGVLGQHAQDLIGRWVISPKPTGEHLMIVPITATKQLIAHLLDHEGVTLPKIVNFSGVMTTSPNATSNLHFLFGPGAKNNLKVAVAWNHTPLVRRILESAESKDIQVIETTRTEHDRKMAIIQGLSHLFLILVGKKWNEEIQTDLIQPWKTPTNTIVDMIFENPFAEEIAVEFFETLRGNKNNAFQAFRQITEKHLTESDREHFSTPNFGRILWSDSDQVRISPSEIVSIRKALNTRGRPFLHAEVESVRSKR